MKLKSIIQYFSALAALAIVFAVLMDQVVMPIYVRQGQVRYLPNVVGLQYPEAESLLREEGFKIEVADTARTQEYPPDQVFEMYPKAYSRVKKGRIIQLTITAEETKVPVPNLVGRTQRMAEVEVAQAGLAIDTVMYQYNDDYEADIVTWQRPQGGNLLERGMGLTLIVSMGEAPPVYYVPSVVGLGLAEGRRQILLAGLEVGNIRRIYDTIHVPNTILDQSIPGATVLQVKRAINLTISTLDESLE